MGKHSVYIPIDKDEIKLWAKRNHMMIRDLARSLNIQIGTLDKYFKRGEMPECTYLRFRSLYGIDISKKGIYQDQYKTKTVYILDGNGGVKIAKYYEPWDIYIQTEPGMSVDEATGRIRTHLRAYRMSEERYLSNLDIQKAKLGQEGKDAVQ